MRIHINKTSDKNNYNRSCKFSRFPKAYSGFWADGTHYSTIKKLEEFNLIETHHVIIKAKLKKSMKITSAGQDLLPELRKRVKKHLKAFRFDDELLNGVK